MSLQSVDLGYSVSVFIVRVMAVLKGIVSLHRAGKEKSIERLKGADKNRRGTLSSFSKHVNG